MRSRLVAALAAAVLACLVGSAEVKGQKTPAPCEAYKNDAAKHADCLDSRCLNIAFSEVLGRSSTDAEFEKWKKTPVLGVASNCKYKTVLLNWLYQPAQSGELSAMISRAFTSISGERPPTAKHAQWQNAAKAEMLTYDQIRNSMMVDMVDLVIAGIANDPGDIHSLMVRVANKGQWATAKPSELYLAILEKCVSSDYKVVERYLFPVPSISAGKETPVKVTTKFVLQGLHPAYYVRLDNKGANQESNELNNEKCINTTWPSKK